MTRDHGGPVQILIVDDDPRVRYALCGFLSVLPGLDVIADASSATAAISMARQHPPTVALVDLFLPDLNDGLDLLRVLTGELQIPVVAISIHDGHRHSALAAGAYQFLSKSSPPELMLTALRAASA